MTSLFGTGAAAVRRAFRGSLVAQSVSYSLLIPLYASASAMGVYSETVLVPSPAFVENREALVYYIAGDGALWRVRLDGAERRFVAPLPSTESDARLAAKRRDDAGFDLYVVPTRALDGVLILDRFALAASPPEIEYHSGLGADYGRAADLRPEGQHNTHVFANFFASDGLSISGQQPLTLYTPVLAWAPRNATVLPGDEVVFQLGPDIICVFDRETRKLAQLARGRGPVVALDDTRAPQ
jgi:hypothetical protein